MYLLKIKNIKEYGQTNKIYFKFSFKYAPNMLQPNGIRFHWHDPLDRKTFGSHGTYMYDMYNINVINRIYSIFNKMIFNKTNFSIVTAIRIILERSNYHNVHIEHKNLHKKVSYIYFRTTCCYS
jgi:hypothetical protein